MRFDESFGIERLANRRFDQRGQSFARVQLAESLLTLLSGLAVPRAQFGLSSQNVVCQFGRSPAGQ